MKTNMRWVCLTLILALSIVSGSAAVQAQTEKPDVNKEEIQKRMMEAKERLQLTDEQVEAIKPLFRTEAEKLRTIRAKYGENPSKKDKRNMMREMKPVQESFNAGMEKILTPDQMKIWKEMKEERKARMKEEYQRRQSSTKSGGY